MSSPYTSARNGLWDASDVDTWGQGLGVYPQTAADVVNIGHTVTYNRVSTAELGQITINNGGLLTFSTTMSTKLTLGHQDILVNSGGELRVGASGAIIPTAYTAELVWNTTSDNAKGVNVASGGMVNIYGDPAYYGSAPFSTLYQNYTSQAQGTTGVNLYVVDNVAGKWLNGQELVVHFGQLYNTGSQDYNKAFFLFTLTADATWDGTKSTLTGTITSYTGTVGTTFAAGGLVVNVSRNVKLYKLGYSNAIGNNNTNRPRVTDANNALTIKFVCSNAQFSGWVKVHDKTASFVQSIMRNGSAGLYPGIGSTFSGAIYSTLSAFYMCQGATLNSDGLLFNCNNSVNSGSSNFINGQVYGNQNGCSDAFGQYGGSVFSCPQGLTGNFQILTPDGCLYWNSSGIDAEGTLIKGSLSFDPAGNQKANTCDINLGATGYANNRGNGGYRMVNAKVLSGGPTFGTSRNRNYFVGRLSCEHYKQVANAHYVFDVFGDIQKLLADGSGSLPGQRPGGSQYVSQVMPQSLCSSINILEIFNVRVWAAAGVAKTYTFYVQNNFSKTLTDAMLALYADYLDNNPAGSGHISTVQSSGVSIANRANQADWSQSISVSVTPQIDGWINLYLRLMDGTNASLWVDPMVVVS